MPHMVSLDAAGDVWVTDVGRHQVMKFTPGGKLLMVVGVKGEPGSDKVHFCKPTQVRGCGGAWLVEGRLVEGG